MELTLSKLIACGIRPTQARTFLGPLVAYTGPWKIDTPLRMAAFLGQCMHESKGFTELEESLFYRDPARIAHFFPSAFRSAADAVPYASKPGNDRSKALASRAYANKYGNGDEASGDGWKFRGRGLMQMTFHDNYRDRGARCGRDWLTKPGDVGTPDGGTLSACVYFADRGCNELADNSAIDAITKKINPAMLGAADRKQLFLDALQVLNT